MAQKRSHKLVAISATMGVLAALLALSVAPPSVGAVPAKPPSGTYQVLGGDMNVGGTIIPLSHANRDEQCQDGIDNETGSTRLGGGASVDAADGLVDFANSGTTGYPDSNGGEAHADNDNAEYYPAGCSSAADDIELFGRSLGIANKSGNDWNCGGFFGRTCRSSTQLIGGTGSIAPADKDPQPKDTFNFANVTVGAGDPGAVSIAANDINFPRSYIEQGVTSPANLDFYINFDLNATGPATGLAGSDGSLSISVPLNVQLTFFQKTNFTLLSGLTYVECTSPITLNLTTGTSGGLTGIPYDGTTLAAQVVDNTFTVPAFTATTGNQTVCDGINTELGLPAAAGASFARINATPDSAPWDTAGTDIVAAAGADQAVTEGDVVSLDGTGSFNRALATPAVAWTQLGGTAFQSIENADTLTPDFVAPCGATTVVMDLAYTTIIGPSPLNDRTDADQVNVAVSNVAPVANAGPDQAASTGQQVTLDGSGSSDKCTPLSGRTYLWNQTSGPAVVLSDPSVVQPTFTPGAAGTAVFDLTVGDGTTTTVDSVSVVVATSVSSQVGGVVTSGGSPQAGVTVRIYNEPAGTFAGKTTTNGSGQWSVTGLTDTASYTARAYDPANFLNEWYRDGSTYRDADVFTAPNQGIDFDITTNANGGSIAGTVTDSSGTPISGAAVRVYDESGYPRTATSAANGTYTVSGLLPKGGYQVRATAASHQRQWYDREYIVSQTTDVTVAAGATTGGIDFDLTPTASLGTIDGTLLNSASGANEVQTYVGSGTWETITFNAVSTSNPIWTAMEPGTFQEILEGLSTIGPGNVLVTGTAGNFSIEFVGALARQNLGQISASGGTPGTTTNGSAYLGVGAGDVNVRVYRQGGGYNGGDATDGTGAYIAAGLPNDNFLVWFWSQNGSFQSEWYTTIKAEAGARGYDLADPVDLTAGGTITLDSMLDP